jgi:hypothetical protein
MRKTRSRWLIMVAVGLAMGVASAAGAETVQVKYPNAKLLAKKSGGSDRLATLKRGDALEVVGKEGGWYKVRAGGKEGYVHENSVTEPGKGLQGTAGASGRVSSSAEAGKGVGESKEWARSAGKSTAGLDRMIALRDEVKAIDFEQFGAEGHVGSAQ